MNVWAFPWVMLKLSFKKMIRDKYSILAEGFEFLIALMLFLGLYQVGVFNQTSFIYVTMALLMMGAIQSGTKLGITLISHKSEGFLQELYSSPLPASIKILGLMAESFNTLLIRTTIILLISLVLGIHITLLQAVGAYVIVLLSAILTSFVSIVISSKTNNPQMLAITMSIIGFLQFGLSGLVIKARDFPIIFANPYSYIADLFLHINGDLSNYPLIVDLALIGIITATAFFTAVFIVEKAEI